MTMNAAGGRRAAGGMASSPSATPSAAQPACASAAAARSASAGVRSKSPKIAGKATSRAASRAPTPARASTRPRRARRGPPAAAIATCCWVSGSANAAAAASHATTGHRRQRGERVGRADAAAAVGVDAEQDEDEGGHRRQRRARAHEDRQLLADHAGPTSRTLAPAASTAASSASLCAASTSATQPPSARGRHLDEPRRAVRGGRAGADHPHPRRDRVRRHPLHPAVVHAQAPRGARQPPVVGAHDQRAAPRGARQQPVERGAGGVVEPAGGLVEDDDVGLARQRRREGHALALAVRQGAQRALQRRVERGGDLLAGVCVTTDPGQLTQPAVPRQPGDGGEAVGGVSGPQPRQPAPRARATEPRCRPRAAGGSTCPRRWRPAPRPPPPPPARGRHRAGPARAGRSAWRPDGGRSRQQELGVLAVMRLRTRRAATARRGWS